MNERLKELAVQAGHRYVPSSNSGPLRVEYLTPEMEKFAELIVRECADLCTKRYREVNEFSDNSPPSPYAVDIKLHFGVSDE